MAFELKDGQGSLHRNDKKGVESRPDYWGEANIGGTMYRLSAWIKQGKNDKWMSLSIALPREQEPASDPKAKPVDVNEDIPF